MEGAGAGGKALVPDGPAEQNPPMEPVTLTTERLLLNPFTTLRAVRVEWRAEVGNAASRAVAEKAGVVVEGTLRAGLLNKGTLRDCWVGGLLPSDLGLPGPYPYLPARS
jgi:hypothetical protein